MRRMLTGGFVVILVAAVAALGNMEPAHAIICETWDIEKIHEEADAIFLGRVVAIYTPEFPASERGRLYSFDVSRVWKGAVPPQVLVRRSEWYDLPYGRGGTYLVYASETPPWAQDPNFLYVGNCDESINIDGAALELQALGKGHLPRPPDPWAFGVQEVVVVVFLALGVTAGTLAWRMRHSREVP